MNIAVSARAGATFEGDDNLWWVTGGYFGRSTDRTEILNAFDNSFSNGVNLPKPMYVHNMVNVNNTHMVLLGGEADPNSDECFMFDRYFYRPIYILW